MIALGLRRPAVQSRTGAKASSNPPLCHPDRPTLDHGVLVVCSSRPPEGPGDGPAWALEPLDQR